MNLRTYQCPYCFEDFKADRDEGSDVDMAPDCGHHFTLGEARRGRPDPANQDEVQALKERVATIEQEARILRQALVAVYHALWGLDASIPTPGYPETGPFWGDPYDGKDIAVLRLLLQIEDDQS